MQDFILARGNGRDIPREDKVFGIANRAKAAVAEKGAKNVINASAGILLDDSGELIVLKSVDSLYRSLTPGEYADYAPICGTVPFRAAVQRSAFGSYEPRGYTEAVVTPGGTGALRNSIANYSQPGDRILTTDWRWAAYSTIAEEIGRTLDTFEMFTADGKYNYAALEAKMREILEEQESLVLILNTPAHNPTGYSLTLEDWDAITEIIRRAAESGKAIALVVDTAYIDFADEEEKNRRFLAKVDCLPENVITIIAYSLSKILTLYGARCGAMICIAATAELADEFRQVCEYSSRASWSNSARVAQTILTKIYEDESILEKINSERAFYRDMLHRRGSAFTDAAAEAGLDIVPFDAGFFVSIPCEDSDEIAARLEKKDVFLIPIKKGLRVSIASISEEKCKRLPAMIKQAMEE